MRANSLERVVRMPNNANVFQWVGSRAFLVRRCQRLPGGEKHVYTAYRDRVLLWIWRAWDGMQLRAEYYAHDLKNAYIVHPWRSERVAINKRAPFGAETGTLPGPSPTSVLLSKFPLLREFLSATKYADGSRRTPGNFRLSSQGDLWEVTLQDPDACARLTFRAVELDKMFSQAEVYLGVEDAPWETDRYLCEKLAEKNEKKELAKRKRKP